MLGNRGKFICFTGLDGAGKTTVARSVAEFLGRKGIDSRYVHSRLNPILSRPFTLAGMALFLRGGQRSQSYQDYAQRKKRLFSHPFLSRGYWWLVSVDYFLQVLFRIAFPLLWGRNIVCDRYVYDTAIFDLALNLHYSSGKTIRAIDTYLSVLPRPDLLFVVDVPEEVAFSRKTDIPDIGYLREARGLFLEVGRRFGAVTLDGSQPREVVGRQAQERVQALFSQASTGAAKRTS